jgi:hypothetical protein
MARACLDPWLAESEAVADQAYGEAMSRYRARVQTLLEALPKDLGTLEVEVPVPEGAAGGLDSRRAFVFTDLMSRYYRGSPVQWLMDRIGPGSWRRRRVERSARGYFIDLVRVNASRVEGDLVERIRRSRQHLEADVRARLTAAVRIAESAADRARCAHASGITATRARTATLAAARDSLAEVMRIEGV